jgi:hypothetical protein
MPLFMTALLVSSNIPVTTGASFIPPPPESVGEVASGMSPPPLLLVLPLLLLVLPLLLLVLLLLELAPPLLPLTPLLLLLVLDPPPLLLLVLLLLLLLLPGVLSVPPFDEQAIARTQTSDERGWIRRMDVLPKELKGYGAAYRDLAAPVRGRNCAVLLDNDRRKPQRGQKRVRRGRDDRPGWDGAAARSRIRR